jgi:hypothetical protein
MLSCRGETLGSHPGDVIPALNVFVVGGEIFRRLPDTPVDSLYSREELASNTRDVSSDVFGDRALHLENAARLRLVSSGKLVGLVAGLNQLHVDCSVINQEDSGRGMLVGLP